MIGTPKHWRFWAIGVAVLWIAAFTLQSNLPQPTGLARPAERWELPTLPARADLTPAAAAVSTSPLWGLPPPAPKDAPPPEDARWTLAATFVRSDRPGHVVVRFAAAKPATFLTVGDKLPDGSKIESIEATQVCVVDDKRKRQCLPVPAVKQREF